MASTSEDTPSRMPGASADSPKSSSKLSTLGSSTSLPSAFSSLSAFTVAPRSGGCGATLGGNRLGSCREWSLPRYRRRLDLRNQYLLARTRSPRCPCTAWAVSPPLASIVGVGIAFVLLGWNAHWSRVARYLDDKRAPSRADAESPHTSCSSLAPLFEPRVPPRERCPSGVPR